MDDDEDDGTAAAVVFTIMLSLFEWIIIRLLAISLTEAKFQIKKGNNDESKRWKEKFKHKNAIGTIR